MRSRSSWTPICRTRSSSRVFDGDSSAEGEGTHQGFVVGGELGPAHLVKMTGSVGTFGPIDAPRIRDGLNTGLSGERQFSKQRAGHDLVELELRGPPSVSARTGLCDG